MSKYSQKAKKMTTASPLMIDREKVDTATIISKYPDGFTLVAFDIFKMVNPHTQVEDEVSIVNIKEDDKIFFYGGSILTSICKEFADFFDGDCEKTSEDLASEGGVKMKLEAGKNKKGQNLTKVIIL